jgi:GT2 family glycosyltransferase
VASGERATILVGSLRVAANGTLTYGGVVRSSRYHPLKFRHVMPADVPLPCDTFNGNCVLISRLAAARVGNLSRAFTHGIADFDYGLRAIRLGCSVWVAPGFVGTCPRNALAGTWEDAGLSLDERWRSVAHPKGLPPAEYRRYAARHGGLLWPVYWGLPYARLLLTGMWDRPSRRRPG